MPTSLLLTTMAANSEDSTAEFLRTTCPHCSKRLKIPLQLAHKQSLKCPKCSQPIRFQEHQPETQSSAVPPPLADTLPYAPLTQADAADELDYLTDFTPAGPGIRLGAFCLDWMAFCGVSIILIAVLYVLYLPMFWFSTMSPIASPEATASIGGFLWAALSSAWNMHRAGELWLLGEMLYMLAVNIAWLAISGYVFWYAACRLLAGPWQATIGKKMLGLIVVDETGHPVTKKQATARWLYRLAGLCCFGLGFLGIQKDPYQTWYDRKTKTQVLRRVSEYHA